jgi:hypothetical protein
VFVVAPKQRHNNHNTTVWTTLINQSINARFNLPRPLHRNKRKPYDQVPETKSGGAGAGTVRKYEQEEVVQYTHYLTILYSICVPALA